MRTKAAQGTNFLVKPGAARNRPRVKKFWRLQRSQAGTVHLPPLTRQPSPLPQKMKDVPAVSARITGYVHCTTPSALIKILNMRAILCSNAVRKIGSGATFTGDRNKAGANGVYARFLLKGMSVPMARYGKGSCGGVRILLDKEKCNDLTVITASLHDAMGNQVGQTSGIGDLSDLNIRLAYNAEICFKDRIPTTCISAIYVANSVYSQKVMSREEIHNLLTSQNFCFTEAKKGLVGLSADKYDEFIRMQ